MGPSLHTPEIGRAVTPPAACDALDPPPAEARFRAVWEASADAMVLSDAAGIVRDVNEAYVRLYGYPAEALIGRSFTIIFPPEARPAAAAEYGQTFARPDVAPLVAATVRRADGTLRQVEVSYTFLLDGAGRRTDMLSIVRDVTGRTAAEAERATLQAREQASRAEMERVREAFLSSASHDLKSPLTTIRGLAQLARRRLKRSADPIAADTTALLLRLEQSTSQMSRLLDELSDVLVGPAGVPLDLQRAPVDLVALARDAVVQSAGLTPHAVTFEASVTRAAVWGDDHHLRRVLENLLSNAVKYSPGGTPIVVHAGAAPATAAAPDGEAVLSVSDRGLGIPAADLPHVFERFRRGTNVVRRIRGSGVGLASARHIVVAHGGTISVVSVEGQGSTFTVRLPLASESAAAGQTVADAPAGAGAGGAG
jgi:PAS domain S-box-containing protein